MLFVTVFFLPMSFGLHFTLNSPIQKVSAYFLIYFSLLHKVEIGGFWWPEYESAVKY